MNGWIADPRFSLITVGAEERNGIAVQHITCLGVPPGESDTTTTALLQRASRMDLFVDSMTWLPVALEFSTHPDNNSLQDIPVRIEFSDYRSAGSGKVPFHIQKYLQNTLLLDISIGSVDINPALPASDFVVN